MGVPTSKTPRLSLFAIALGIVACASPYRVHELSDDDADGPRLLCIVAHPDDEIAFAGTLYKTATALGGACDVLTITNGEGGFKYSTLAERIYGLELTDEAVGRRHLPAIRERELLAGCRILGVRRVILLEQRDHRFTLDAAEVLAPGAGVWDLELVRERLRRLLRGERYDFVLTLAPTSETHGHHKAAAILALEAVRDMPAETRPVVLCCRTTGPDELAPRLTPLEDHPETRVRPGTPFVFDRTQGFGYRDRLNYSIVANWAIAEHKSQGTMQLSMNGAARERYYLFEENPEDAHSRASELFRSLSAPQFPSRSYGPSAGTIPTPLP